MGESPVFDDSHEGVEDRGTGQGDADEDQDLSAILLSLEKRPLESVATMSGGVRGKKTAADLENKGEVKCALFNPENISRVPHDSAPVPRQDVNLAKTLAAMTKSISISNL